MNFEDLDVWRRSVAISVEVYREVKGLNDFGFRDQITRSGLSIPSNIAEGFERDSDRDCMKFLLYAKGSCGELRTQIHIGIQIGYIPEDIGEKWIKETKEMSRMLGGLIRSKRGFLAKGSRA
jgi:four helix bundle protein